MEDSQYSPVRDVFGTLFLIFLVLKLCGLITWSWWWVTSPLWIPLAIGIVITFLEEMFNQ